MAENETAVAVGEREHPGQVARDDREGRGRNGAARRGLEPRHRPPLLRHRRRPAPARRRHPRRLLDPLPRGHRADPGAARRRQDPRLLRLPDPAQRRPRALQGRDPLPPRGRRRRGPRARVADDLEDGGRRSPVRRRQGRRQLPGRRARAGRAAADRALVHGQDREGARARRATSRPPTSAPTPRPWPGSWTSTASSTATRRRSSRASRSRSRDRSGAKRPPAAAACTCSARPRRSSGSAPPTPPSSIQGYGNVGSWAGADHAAARRQDGRRLGRQRGDPQRRRHRRQRASRAHLQGRPDHRVRRASSRSTPTTWSPSPATCSSPRRWAG